MNVRELESIASRIVSPGKGVLAADESTNTMGKRLSLVGVENTEENRRRFREALFTTPRIEEFISGVILYDETIRQKMEGRSVPDLLASRGIVAGIKVDKGTKPLGGSTEEVVTEGLDGLFERLREYRTLGARFAKWRAVFHVGGGRPTSWAIRSNASALARYALLCQEAGLVPIVEPEVLMEGGHTVEESALATERVLHGVFRELVDGGVLLEGCLLKTNMVLAGENFHPPTPPPEVASWTLRVLRRTVPAACPGILFLSGGQEDERATDNLNAIAREGGPKPWALTFSYGRALQHPALVAWKGESSRIPEAQKAFQKRARLNALATRGEYTVDSEREG